MALANPIMKKARFSQIPASQIRDKRWGVRVDFNGITSARLQAAVKTTAKIIGNGGTAVLFSHNGRPNKIDRSEWQGLSLFDAAAAFNLRLIEAKVVPEGVNAVRFVPETIGSAVRKAASQLSPETPVLLTENTRFYKMETAEKADVVMAFAEQMIGDAAIDHVVTNGFSAMHRSHASVTGIARAVRKKGGIAALGLEAENEITFIWNYLIAKPHRPFIGLLGGAKVSGKDGKLKFLQALLPGMDAAVIGGAMLYPFLLLKYGKYAGKDPLAEIRETGELDADIAAARQVLDTYGDKLILPTTLFDPARTGAIDIKKEQETDFVMRGIEEAHLMEKLAALSERFNGIGTAVVNGTFSKTPEITEGTYAAYAFINSLTKRGALTVAGGGDTGKAIKQARKDGLEVEVGYTPTGGGAMLAVLSNRNLPGIEALSDA
ncbi:phosphoglycerate kinase [Candidatus Margulisiibacteriota bacterium]